MILQSRSTFIASSRCYGRILAVESSRKVLLGTDGGKLWQKGLSMKNTYMLGGGFKYFFVFIPTWGNDPI